MGEGESSGPPTVEGGPIEPGIRPLPSSPEAALGINTLEAKVGELRDKIANEAKVDIVSVGPPSGAEPITPQGQEVKHVAPGEAIPNARIDENNSGQRLSEDEANATQAQGAEANASTKPEQNPTPETEAQAPTEAPKVPRNLASNTEYIRILGERYAKLKQQGAQVTEEQIKDVTRQSLSEYYGNLAKDQVEKGLPKTIKEDLLYQQKLGEAVSNAQDNGESLDKANLDKLSQEVLAKYLQEKDLQEEKAEQPENQAKEDPAKLDPNTERRIADLTNQVEGLSVENEQMRRLMEAVLKHLKEEDPKKKKTLLQFLLEYAAIIGLNTAIEAGKVLSPKF